MLIPQSKPSTSQPATSRTSQSSETKEVKNQPPNGVSNATAAPKRPQKRRPSESSETNKPFTKIRLQRPVSPTSPVVTVKLEPLDIPLSPTEMFSDGQDDHSSPSRFENMEDFRGDNREERVRNGANRDLKFSNIPGPPNLNDTEEQMEFVPTDFLEQEQDILDEHEQDDMDRDGEDGDDGDDVEEGEDGDDLDDGDDGEDLINDRDELPGRSKSDIEELDDEENDIEYSEKLSEENNMT